MTDRDRILRHIVWQEIYWSQPLSTAYALNLLRQWASQPHAPQIILEARATKQGTKYLIGSQHRYEVPLRREIEHLVPGTVVVNNAGLRKAVDVVRRITTSQSSRALSARDADGSLRSLLTSLSGLRASESLVIQVVLGPRLAPHLLPARPARFDQSIGSLLTTGSQTERRPQVLRQLEIKQADHGFAAILRVGVTAADAARRRALVGRVETSFRTLLPPGVRLREHREKPFKLNSPEPQWAFFAPAQHLSVPEVALLSAWPIGEPEQTLPGLPPIHPRQLRPSFEIKDSDRVVALSTAPGTKEQALGLSVADSCRHVWLMGPTGVGKSSLLLNLIHGDMTAGRGLVLIEPKDLIRDVLAVIPDARRDDVVVLDPLDPAPVGINPLDLHGRSPTLVADQLFGTFRSLYGADGLGPRTSDILRHCLLALASRGDASLAMLPALLTNPGFRRSITQHIARKDPLSAGPFWHWFDQLTPEATIQVTAPLMNKLRPLLGPHLRPIVAQRQPRFDIRQVLNEGKILLVPLQKGVIGPEAAELLGALVVAELWQAIQERAAKDPKDRRPVMVYLDEVQDYLRLPTDIADALATARSLGAAFHVAHQFLDQLPLAMRSAFEANCRSRIFFQLSMKDARAAASMAPGLDAVDFTALPARHIYSQLVHHGSVTDWASGKIPETPQKSANVADIRARSRRQYGQPIGSIDQGLLDALVIPEAQSGSDGRRKRSTP